jgi:hypothetical protein
MATYVVMEPGARATADGESAVFVRDGFSFIAFLVPFAWLFWHRLWIEGALALGALLLLGVLDDVGGMGMIAVGLSLLMSIYVGLEGPALRMAALRRRGWRDRAVIDADCLDDAETRYLSGPGEEHEEVPPADMTPRATVRPRPVTSAPALGLLGYGGGR